MKITANFISYVDCDGADAINDGPTTRGQPSSAAAAPQNRDPKHIRGVWDYFKFKATNMKPVGSFAETVTTPEQSKEPLRPTVFSNRLDKVRGLPHPYQRLELNRLEKQIPKLPHEYRDGAQRAIDISRRQAGLPPNRKA